MTDSPSSSPSSSPIAPIAPIERIYTDGACSGNPGPGGWGTVIYFADGGIQELGGGDRATTNNRMEMQAAIDGLKYYAKVGQGKPIVLYTDSEYVKNGITKWISGWKKKGWKTSTGKAVLNQDLWEELDALNSKQVEWLYVKGHSGNEGNERCDEIARAYSHKQSIALKQYQPSQNSPSQNSPSQNSSEYQSSSMAAIELSYIAEAMFKASAGIPAEISSEILSEIPSEKPQLAKLPPTQKSQPQPDLNSTDLEDMQMLRDAIDRLRMADEVCQNHYLLTTQELAVLLNLSPKTISARKEDWVWRNWLISKVREESNQMLWQLERVEEL